MKIYTKKGDGGQTSLFSGKRVSKSHCLVEIYGLFDELIVLIGDLICHQDRFKTEGIVSNLQSQVFSLGSFVASEFSRDEYIKNIESWVMVMETEIDRMDAELPALKNFILPGGGLDSICAHKCRVQTRNIERKLVADVEGKKEAEDLIKYFNRLSDYFFVLARYLNHIENREEQIWKV